MSRLIDADKLLEIIEEHKNITQNLIYRMAHDHIIEVINLIPTAYDIDNVVEELEKEQEEIHKSMCIYPNKEDAEVYSAYENAIEIVKAGVKNEH